MIHIKNKEFNYPVLCLSIVGKYLVFTTKKTGSRYFEDISSNIIDVTQKNSINFYVSDYKNDNLNINNNFLGYSFECIHNHKLLNVDQFNNLLKINKFSDIFSDRILSDFEFVFITRDPMDRLFTGFFEKIGSIITVNIEDSNNQFLYNIIKKYFSIYDYDEFNKLSQDKINLILNEFSISVNHNLLNDEHISLWNYFLIDFLKKSNLYDKVKIIDLNDRNKMSIFTNIQQPSNKPWLSKWLSDENNKRYIDNMIINLKPYMDLEIQAYNKLLNK